MKKRLATLVMAFVMVLSLAVPAFAATSEAPYSLSYLKSITGVKYVNYVKYDDEKGENFTTTEFTMEIYDALDLWTEKNGSWAETVLPFRTAFKSAGFREIVEKDKNNQDRYTFVLDHEYFTILGEKVSHDMMDESAVVYILHQRAVSNTSTTADNANSGSETNSSNKPTGGISEVEPNNSSSAAQWITLGQPVHGSFESLEDVDFYKFVLNQRSDIKLTVSSDDYKFDSYLWVRFYDASGKGQTLYDYYADDTKTTHESRLNDEFASGTCYISVSVFGGSNDSKYVGSKYTLTVEATPKSDVTPSYDNFTNKETYTDGLFTDVPAQQWYAETVKTAYELGLVKGSSATTFNPDGNVTIAETLAFACRVHGIYNAGEAELTQGNPWYQVYVDYAIANGIIKEGDYTDYTATATRAQFASILYKALPADAWTKLNDISAIPDVAAGEAYADVVLALYNAGVLTGSDAKGTFNPSSNISRSEVATIVARMAVPSLRKSFTLAA